VQFFNPFLPIIAAGTGLGVIVMGRLVALRSLMGLTAPILGSLADRIGYRMVVRLSMLLVGAGMLLAGLSGNLLLFALAMVLAGSGHIGFTANLHAYLSARLPYRRRAMGLGILEYSWALAGIVGLFLSGQLIEALSWRAPFLFLGAALLIMSLVYATLPAGSRQQTASPPGARATIQRWMRLSRFFDLGEHAGSAWACVAVSGFNTFAMMHLLIIHGQWLATEYGLGAGALGSVALAFGLVDLTASFLVSVGADRIGKKRGVIIGVCGLTAGMAVLPLLNRTLPLALLAIAMPRFCFEIAIVTGFSLLSEQDPGQRGKVMSMGMTMGLIGATIAGLTGPSAYLRWGVWGLGPVSAGSALVSLLLLVLVVREAPHRSRAANKA
jgi:predicted MFS family arabinose efflux permease